MTPEEQATIDAVTAKLMNAYGIYDNPVTQRREFWRGGRLVRERRRDACTGVAHYAWGTYPDPPAQRSAA